MTKSNLIVHAVYLTRLIEIEQHEENSNVIIECIGNGANQWGEWAPWKAWSACHEQCVVPGQDNNLPKDRFHFLSMVHY